MLINPPVATPQTPTIEHVICNDHYFSDIEIFPPIQEEEKQNNTAPDKTIGMMFAPSASTGSTSEIIGASSTTIITITMDFSDGPSNFPSIDGSIEEPYQPESSLESYVTVVYPYMKSKIIDSQIPRIAYKRNRQTYR